MDAGRAMRRVPASRAGMLPDVSSVRSTATLLGTGTLDGSPWLAPFTLSVPGDWLDVQIAEREGGAAVLLSSLIGKRAPLTAASLSWMSIKYPLITLKVIGLIHAHAAVLWLKRVPWHRKAAHPALQRGILRPHVSISGKRS